MGAETKDKGQKQRRRPGRVPTSCAECRRLKLRCDRNVPCEKCVSRGCGAICPDGSLTPGKGNRLVLANTEELHDRIEHLCSRIRELEEALRTLQQGVSDSPHPLLQPDLLLIKAPQAPPPTPVTHSLSSDSPSPPCQSVGSSGSPQVENEDESLIDSFGTLAIGIHGEASFLGNTARSEYLIRVLAKPSPLPNVVYPHLSKRIIESGFPEFEPPDESLSQEVLRMLPPLSEAFHLCEIYLEHGKYLYVPLPRTELFDEILTAVYRPEPFNSFGCPHALSLLFIIFAIAALLDPKRSPYSIEAQEYYHLSRKSLGFASPARDTTLASIQTLIHMAEYLELSDWESSGSEFAWLVLGHAVRLGHSVGLHLDSARWKLSEDITQRRSRVFWQLLEMDTWTSFCYGRPPSMSPAYIDCPPPNDTEGFVGRNGQQETGYHAWIWQYTTQLHSVMATAFGPKPPSYHAIVDLDRKIRDFPVPVRLRPYCEDNESPKPTPDLYMQRWMVLSAKEWTLLNLHRAYFAQALEERPDNLMKHRYIPSVIAIYRSAWRIIHGLKSAWRNVPLYLSRLSLSWSQALSAAIVMCLLVTRAPTSNMAEPSLQELDSLAVLFEEAAPNCRSAAKILDSIKSLQLKAHEALNPSTDSNTLCPTELDRLGGKTHLISKADSCVSAPPPVPPTRPPPPPPASIHESMSAFTIENMHPTIAQDIRNIDFGGSAFHNIFDLPADPLPRERMHDTQPHEFSAQAPVDFHLGYQANAPAGFGAGAPILDSTWQSFVEQLGF